MKHFLWFAIPLLVLYGLTHIGDKPQLLVDKTEACAPKLQNPCAVMVCKERPDTRRQA